MMSAKMESSGFLKIKTFWNKVYNVIISAYDITNKILWHDSNYIVNVVMWPKFANSSIFMSEVIITWIPSPTPSPLPSWIGLKSNKIVYVIMDTIQQQFKNSFSAEFILWD